MYKIKLTGEARRELAKLSKTDKLRLGEIIEDLKENPSIGKQLSRELTGKLSYRIGVYRIIYQVNEKDKNITIASFI